MKKFTNWVSSNKLTVIPITVLLILGGVAATIIGFNASNASADKAPATQSTQTSPVKAKKSEGTAEINQAVVKGDDSLKGDKGKEIVQKLEENVKANPNVSDETKANAEETAKTEAVNEPAKPVQNSKPAEPAKTTSHAPAPKRIESSPKPATPAAKPAAQAPKQPAIKAKVRKPIYKKVWKEEIYNVQYPISGGQKEVGYYCIMSHNGQRVETAEEANAILRDCLRKGIDTSFSFHPIYEYTPVVMGTRQEKRGKWVDEIVGYEWVEQTN